jgi:hypothetical protein
VRVHPDLMSFRRDRGVAMEMQRPARAPTRAGRNKPVQGEELQLSRALAGPLDAVRERAECWPSYHTPSAIQAGRGR